MLKIDLFTVERGGFPCVNPKCQKLPEYTYNLIGEVYHLKVGSLAVEIELSSKGFEYYCGGCINDLFNICKFKLDKKLWAFNNGD